MSSKLKNASRAIDLFQACVQGLIDADNFKPFFLEDVRMYVFNSFVLEDIKDVDEKEYLSFKETVEGHAKSCGYPLLQDIDAMTTDEKKKALDKNLLTHLRTYGVPGPDGQNIEFNNMFIDPPTE